MSNSQLDKHITEETVHAWLDHELGRRESGMVEQHAHTCTECAQLLNECRELRGIVSRLLDSFDEDLAAVPRASRYTHAKLVLSSRAPSAPIISHIVADSQPAQFWPSARKVGSMAALALIFAGTASIVMVRGYHAVAGSVNAVANARSTTALFTSKNALTVTGTVTPGAVNPEMNNVLPPLVRTLEPFVVTTAQPNWTSPAHQSCLTSFEPYSSADPRMFQALSGAIRPTGDFRMEVVDWPMPGNTVSAVFAMESAGTLVGRVRAKTAELRITLTRDGEVWRGSASETRNYKPRWRRVAMRESGCAN